MRRHKTVAFYLPQFHPTDENDTFWFPGYTEWHAAASARPRFHGHRQPLLPRDLGFYDLRLLETHRQQAALAKQYGIDAFCFYHYWFRGRRVLNAPFDLLRTSGSTLPLLLCWANESWTRAWDGSESEILLRQTYTPEDDRQHANWLADAFLNPSYFRLDGRPVFLMYRPRSHPAVERFAEYLFRSVRKSLNAEPILLAVESSGEPESDPRPFGFHGAVEFPPRTSLVLERSISNRARSRITSAAKMLRSTRIGNIIIDYGTYVEAAVSRKHPGYPRFPGVMPSWDNSPRRPNSPATVFVNSTPVKYERWLTHAREVANQIDVFSEALIFINAWNEWGEGAVLEPSSQWGLQYLEATKRAVM